METDVRSMIKELEQTLDECQRECVSLKRHLAKRAVRTTPGEELRQEFLRQNLNAVNGEFSVSRIFDGHFGSVVDFDFTRDSSRLVSVSRDGRMLLWDVLSAELRGSLRLNSPWVSACASDWLSSAPPVAGGSAKHRVAVGTLHGQLYVHVIGEDDVCEPPSDWLSHIPVMAGPSEGHTPRSRSPTCSGSCSRSRSRSKSCSSVRAKSEDNEEEEEDAKYSECGATALGRAALRQRLSAASLPRTELRPATYSASESYTHTHTRTASELLATANVQLTTVPMSRLPYFSVATKSVSPAMQQLAATSLQTVVSDSTECRKASKTEVGKLEGALVLEMGADSQQTLRGKHDNGSVIISSLASMARSFATPIVATSPSLRGKCSHSPLAKASGLPKHCVFALEKAHSGKAAISGVQWRSGGSLVTAAMDGCWKVWDLQRTFAVATSPPFAHDKGVTALRLRNELLLTGSADQSVKVWDLRASRECQCYFKARRGAVSAVQWFPNGMAFAIGTVNGSAQLFDIRANAQLAVFKLPRDEQRSAVTSLSFSQSGRVLFVGSRLAPFCEAYAVANSAPLCALYHNNAVTAVKLSPDGTLLCTASADSFLRSWHQMP